MIYACNRERWVFGFLKVSGETQKKTITFMFQKCTDITRSCSGIPNDDKMGKSINHGTERGAINKTLISIIALYYNDSFNRALASRTGVSDFQSIVEIYLVIFL
uniref:Uncharacterized protein n=1 Tax=Cacopsylla melanoneura TaxID=428564 RepID=A0A8D8RSW2_9HEMI